ncbi:MAG: phosphoribosyl-ATP diphosphatase [Clostridiales bacterium]|nr:phosphoribosyl-ATP diphosphatase [Clostridiales bacterium]
MSIDSALWNQYRVVLDRKQNPGGEKSYTSYLYSQGLNKILKKCGEETFEAVIAAKGDDRDELLGELGDVLYHVTVLLCSLDIPFADVLATLNRRCGTEGQPVDALLDAVSARKNLPVLEGAGEGSSYTAYLLQQGTDKILKKVGESCALLLLAAKDGNREETVSQCAGLLYHLLVLLVNEDIPAQALGETLDLRNGATGNLKTFHQTDVNT